MLNRLIHKGSAANNALILFMGNTTAQVIQLFLSLILTKAYTPKEFGVYALYLSMLSLLSIVVTAQYENAILLPLDDRDALNILIGVIVLSFFLSFIILLIILILQNHIIAYFKNPEVARWFFFIPLGVFSIGSYQGLYFWLNRKAEYKMLAINRILQSALIASIALFAVFMRFGIGGIILGTIAGQIIATFPIGLFVWNKNKVNLGYVNYNSMCNHLVKYKNFPLYALPANFVNVSLDQIPTIIFMNFFGSANVGFLGLTQKVLNTPISLISNSISDVFKEQSSKDYSIKGNCENLFLKTLKGLTLLSCIPFLLFFFSAPYFFSFVFGEKWRVSGEIAQILLVMLFLRFITRPLSYIFYLAGKQNLDFFLHCYMAISTVLCIFAGYHFFRDFKGTLILFAVNFSFLYIVYLYLSFIFSKGIRKKR